MTLLGLGGLPASHLLNLGMMGMHGEAWVNKTIQEADLLLAFGMRFDDRVTGNLKTYAHEREEDSRGYRSGGDQQEREGGRGAWSATCARFCTNCCRESRWATGANGWSTSRRLKGDSAVRDIQNLPDNGHLYAAHVINDLWHETRDREAVIVTDVGQHQMWEAQYYKHEHPRSLITSGRTGDDGLCFARGYRRKGGACPNRTCGSSSATAAFR